VREAPAVELINIKYKYKYAVPSSKLSLHRLSYSQTHGQVQM